MGHRSTLQPEQREQALAFGFLLRVLGDSLANFHHCSGAIREYVVSDVFRRLSANGAVDSHLFVMRRQFASQGVRVLVNGAKAADPPPDVGADEAYRLADRRKTWRDIGA